MFFILFLIIDRMTHENWFKFSWSVSGKKKKKKKSWTNFYQVFDLSRFGSGGFNKQM